MPFLSSYSFIHLFTKGWPFRIQKMVAPCLQAIFKNILNMIRGKTILSCFRYPDILLQWPERIKIQMQEAVYNGGVVWPPAFTSSQDWCGTATFVLPQDHVEIIKFSRTFITIVKFVFVALRLRNESWPVTDIKLLYNLT